ASSPGRSKTKAPRIPISRCTRRAREERRSMIRGNERAIDLGLSVLAAVSPAGRCHTLDEITLVCEEARNVLKCSPHRITRQDFWFLEHRALQKLQRAAIRRMRQLRT